MVMSISNKIKVAEKKVTQVKSGKSVKVTAVKKTTTPKVLLKKEVKEKKVQSKIIKPIENEMAVKKKTTARKTFAKKTEPKEVVSIPTVPSLRLVEKVQVYRLWYKNNLSRYAASTARYGGYVFVALGTILATSSYLVEKNFTAVTAAVVCSEDICNEIPDAALPAGSPLVTFLTALPVKLETDSEMLIKVENAVEVEVSLINTLSGQQTILVQTEAPTDGIHHFLIAVNELQASAYTLSAKVKADSIVYQFTGPNFTVPSLEIVEPAPEAVVIVEEEVEAVEVSSSTELMSEEEKEKTIEIIKPTAPISIALKQLDDSKYLTIKTGDFLPTVVEVYSKLEFSDEPVFLGLATLVQGEWIFSLTALELPVAKHLIFSAFTLDGKTYQSEGVLFTPPAKEILNIATDADLAILIEKVKLGLENASVTPATRQNFFSGFSSTSEAFAFLEEKQFAANATLAAVNTAMADETLNLNALLERYASAVQGGNIYLINLADSMLTEHYKSLAHVVAIELDDNSVIPSLTTILSLRYQVLKEKVKTFEALIKHQTNDLINRDSDHDGLSDFDEVTLYETNPLMTDSDSDGVTDAVEVIKGFDPLNSDIRSAATVMQNIDEVVYDDVVSISSVEPLVIKGLEATNESVFALVQGQSLPNAFVTVISYTSSTLGIIKTNSTGKFAYTLEKELNDGDYEMVAVLSDNFGSIVASSKPYKFTKNKNVFAIGTVGSKHSILSPEEFFSPTLAHNVTAAIGVVAFGFILILLGQTLRSRRGISIKENTEQTA